MTDPVHDNKLRSFEFTLRAERRSSHTIRQYLGSASRFLDWLGDRPADADAVRAYLVELDRSGMAPATVRHRYAGLRAYFKWCEDELCEPSPMARLKPPSVPETQKDVVPAEEMARVLASLDRDGRSRDAAIVSLLYDTGMRASELIAVKRQDVDWAEGTISLRLTKNRQLRVVAFGPSTARRLDRWERKRPDKRAVFLFSAARTGKPLTRSGLYQLISKVFADAGIPHISPHDLRHTSATHFMEDESARESDLQTLMGWNSPQMAQRYTKSRRVARAIAAHRRLSPVERLVP